MSLALKIILRIKSQLNVLEGQMTFSVLLHTGSHRLYILKLIASKLGYHPKDKLIHCLLGKQRKPSITFATTLHCMKMKIPAVLRFYPKR